MQLTKQLAECLLFRRHDMHSRQLRQFLLLPTLLAATFASGCASEAFDELDAGRPGDQLDIEDAAPNELADSVTQVVSAESGGILQITGGPFAGLVFTVPPGALAEDTQISLSTGGANSLGKTIDFASNPEL